MQENINLDFSHKLEKLIVEMLLESSPCVVCGNLVGCFSLYCSHYGTKNSNFDPSQIGENSANLEIDCNDNHVETIEIGLVDQNTPYCSVCGLKIIQG